MPGNVAVGYAALSAGAPLEPFTYRQADLADGEIRVSVTHCGLCFTDVHAIDNHFGVFSFPLVPGHEVVGRVTEVGRGVSGLRAGVVVGVGWQGRSCGECQWCREGEDHLCRHIASCGTWTPYGGFSSSLTVDARFAHPVPPGLSPEAAAVLMCAGIAVYSPLRRYVGPSRRVGIVGIGGLGHLAVQFAHALGCEVTALSTSPGKEQEARSLGADHFLVSTDRAAMAEAEFRFDLLLCTAHGELDWSSLLMSLTKRGRLALVAFPSLQLGAGGVVGASGPLVDLVVHELSITGSFLGSPAEMREMLGFAAEHGITPWTEIMPMSQVNGAIERLRHNRVRYRIVLTNP
jgi:uncharacterized zinc-type alcohol dehydrogenase-like protein